MTLLERHKELALLQERFTEVVRGTGRVVLLTGAVGSGKTELLDTFARRASSAGAMFLGATASSTERDLPLGVVGQLLGGAGIAPEAIDRIMAGGQRVAMGPPGSPTTEGRLVEVLRAVSTTVLNLARQQPVMIGVDDVHLCDTLSQQTLLYLVRRMRSARLLVVLSEMAAAQPATPLLHAELMSQPHCSRLPVALLSRDGVAEFLHQQLPSAPPDQLADACHEATGGNPLLVQAVALDQFAITEHPPPPPDGAPGPSGGLRFGEAFGQAVVTYLYRCPPEHRDVARAVAVLDACASPALIARLTGLDAATVDRTLGALRLGGLVKGDRLRHPRARTAILHDIDAAQSSELHRRSAALLYADSAPPAAVARHLVAAGSVDFPWAAATLRVAAEAALDHGASAAAVDWLKLAYRCSADDPGRARVKAVLARAEWRTNPSLAARHFDDLGAAIRLGHLTGRNALMLIRWMLWYGRAEEAIEMADRTSDDGDPEFAADLRFTQLWIAYLYPAHRREQLAHPGPSGPTAPGAITAPGVPCSPEFRAGAILQTVMSHGVDDAAVIRIEQILQRTVLSDSTLAPLTTAIAALVYADEFDRAAVWCARLSRQAQACSAPTWQAILSAMQAAIAMRQGDLPAAITGVRRAFALLPPGGWGVAIGLPLSTMLRAATAAGDYDQAARQLDQPIPESMFESTFGLPYLHARGGYYLATNRLHAALDDFHACGRLMDEWGVDGPSLVPWRTEAAQVWIKLGGIDAARDLIKDQLRMVADERSPARGITLRIQAATSDGPDRLAVITEAVDILAACGDRLELARALADMSRVQQEIGDIYEARQSADRAWAVARECHAEALCRTLLPSLDSIPTGPTDVADPRISTLSGRSLSDAERRVAALAASGRTNREIAGDLFVTVSTVEQHLTRVYRKLQVHRRADLLSRLRDPDSDFA